MSPSPETGELHGLQGLQQISDRLDIAELISRLGLWLDEKRFDDGRSILAEDVVVRTRAGTVQGVEAAERHARERHVEDRSQSVISDILIDLHGDRAAARANLTATFVPDASNPGQIYTVGEWYQFSLTRTPQGWRFARIEANPIWRTEDPSDAR